MKKSLFLIALMLIIIAGCSKDDEEKESPKTNVEKAIEAIPDKATAKSITITGEMSDQDWALIKYIRKQLPSLEEIILSDAQNIKGGIFAYNDDIVWNTNQWLKSFKAPKAKTIDDRAFMFCEELVKIEISMVETIGKEAFNVCESLEELSLPRATQIGDEAFVACSKLSKISLPVLTSVNDELFRSCKSLADISLPKVTSIGMSAFVSCDNLREIKLGSTSLIKTHTLAFEYLQTKNISLYITGANWDEVERGNIWRNLQWHSISKI